MTLRLPQLLRRAGNWLRYSKNRYVKRQKPIACSECFSNFGFRQVLEALAFEPTRPCPSCGSFSGRQVDKDGLVEAIVEFFVVGSYMIETFAPAYQANDLNNNPARFDSTLQADADLASRLTGWVVFHYGPPLWRLGITNHYHAFAEGGAAAQTAAEELVDMGHSCTVGPDTELFRIRLNPEADERLVSAGFDPPPPNVVREPGRWDNFDMPALYVSNDLELCLHECRTTIADEIVVARLQPLRDLKLLDLTQDLPTQGDTPFDDPNIFIRILSRSRGYWLGYGRLIAQVALNRGYHGIRYNSYYAQAKHETKALNLALFGRPIADGLLRVMSVNRLRITDMAYAYRFGPALYMDAKMRADVATMKSKLAGMKSKWEAFEAGLESD